MAQSNLISTRIALDGATQIIEQLRSMGSAGENAIRQIQQAAAGTSGPIASLGRATGALKESFHEAHGSVSALAESIGPAVSRFNRFTRAFEELRGVVGVLAPALKEFAEIGIGVGLFLAAKKGSDAIRELKDQSEVLGLTLEKLQGLQFAAAQKGIPVENFVKGLDRFSAVLGDITKKREEFDKSAGLKAAEQTLATDKATEAINKAGEATGRAARENEANALGLQKAELAQRQLTTAVDQHYVATEKLRQQRLAQGGAGSALGQNISDRIKESEVETKLTQSRISAAEATMHARNAGIESANNLRSAEVRLREAQLESSITTEKNRIEAEKQRDVFQRLGVDIEHGPNEALLNFAERLEGLKDAAARSAALREVFGRDWVRMADFFSLGSAGIRKFQETYAEKVISITDEDAKLADDFQASWAVFLINLKNGAAVFGNLIGSIFIPVMNALGSVFKSNETAIRDFSGSFVRVLKPAVETLIQGFTIFGNVIVSIGGVVRSVFNGWADIFNKVFGWDIKGSDLIVGLFGFYGLAALIIPRIISIGAAILSLIGPFARVATVVIGLRTSAFIPLIATMTGPVGFVVAIGAILAALAYFDPTARSLMGRFFAFMQEGFHNLIETAKAGIRVYEALIEVIQRFLGASESSLKVPQPKYERDKAPTSDEVARRVEQENPGLYNPIARAGGGSIPGMGRGDHVPVVAEPGEYMVQRSAVSQVGLGFMNMLNNGLVAVRMAAGGIVAGMGSTNPSPAHLVMASPSGAANESTALFHLTFGDKTFRNLSAPESTAQEMHNHARSRARTQMGPAQGWKR